MAPMKMATPPPPVEKLLHELQVHQIELEMQNEQLRQLQVELEDSHNGYVDLYDFAPVGYLTLNHKGMIEEINLTGAAMFGDERGKLTQRPFAAFVAPVDSDQWHLHFQSLLKHDNKLTYELQLLHNNSTSFYAQLDCLRINKVEGAPVVRVTLADITERKQAEAEKSIGSTTFMMQESMLITDSEGVILRVNPAFTECTGYAPEEVIGKTPRLLQSGHHNADFYHEMRETLKCKGNWRGEIWNQHKNGETYPKLLTITTIKNHQGIVTHYVGSHIDISERLAAENEIKNLAFYDPLTHLPNRRLLLDRFKQALIYSARSGRQGAVLFIDLDNFKKLNDTLGHGIGDLLLQQVSERLESCVREGDTVARLGGDEFVVLLTDLNEQAIEAATQTKTIGNKILLALSQPYLLATHICHSTPSIGATLFNDVGQGAEELFKQADIAMYQAKKNGRCNLCFFDPEMQLLITAHVALESDLRHAITEKKQLVLYYQPQVDLHGHLVGVEALLRWQHPERGLIYPGDFIPLAEESGLILPLGYWVLTTACYQLLSWMSHPDKKHLTMAVNVSAKQFNLPTFVDEVLTLIDQTGIDPTKLKLEITESMMLNNVENIISNMNIMKKHGINFSMDDFGTGYSSLQYLKSLPLDQLKIDQSFVRDLSTNINNQAIVRTIIAMAKNLDMNIIAEGVETEEQRQLLINNGCTIFQGYLFGRPMPIEQFDAPLLTSQFHHC